MPKAATKPTYKELNDELEQLLAKLQQDDIDIDAALKEYEHGLELIAQLEAHLQQAETTIIELQAKASPDA